MFSQLGHIFWYTHRQFTFRIHWILFVQCSGVTYNCQPFYKVYKEYTRGRGLKINILTVRFFMSMYEFPKPSPYFLKFNTKVNKNSLIYPLCSFSNGYIFALKMQNG